MQFGSICAISSTTKKTAIKWKIWLKANVPRSMISGLCTAQFWPRYCWHLTPPMVISHQKSGRTSLIRISRPLLNHHSPKKAWLLKYQCQDLSDKEGCATAGNIYTTSNRPETGKKRGQQWRQHQFHFLPSFSTCQVTWPPQGEEIVSMTTRLCHHSGNISGPKWLALDYCQPHYPTCEFHLLQASYGQNTCNVVCRS